MRGNREPLSGTTGAAGWGESLKPLTANTFPIRVSQTEIGGADTGNMSSRLAAKKAHLISISRIQNHHGTEVSQVRFRGAVRGSTIEDFRGRLQDAGGRSPYLMVDLSELDYVSSTGLSLLLLQAQTQEKRGGWLRILAPSPAVSMILELSGVAETLPPAGSEEEVLESLTPRAA